MSALIPDLGKHAAYIWLSLGAAVVSLAAIGLGSWWRMVSLERAADEARAARKGGLS